MNLGSVQYNRSRNGLSVRNKIRKYPKDKISQKLIAARDSEDCEVYVVAAGILLR